LFEAVARLTLDGRIPRDQTAAFLERFERDHIAGDEDMSWLSWEDAVIRLGLTHLEPALRRVWARGLPDTFEGERDEASALARLAHAAANPSDPKEFDESLVRPIDDAVEGLAWVNERTALMETFLAEHEGEFAGGTTADAGDLDLEALLDEGELPGGMTDPELTWLDGFLGSRQVPETTMSLEMLDGYLTALVIGPDRVGPAEYFGRIWGPDGEAGPVWDSDEQAAHFAQLVGKLAAGIAEMAESGDPIDPLLLEVDDEASGADWAQGFEEGMGLRAKSWEPLFRNPTGARLGMAIVSLTGQSDEHFETEMTPEIRAEVLEELPVMLQTIATFWREGASALPGHRPARSVKVGRNETCPCGSGKKYKKCCGSAGSDTIH
jgi:uncharacterized protein